MKVLKPLQSFALIHRTRNGDTIRAKQRDLELWMKQTCSFLFFFCGDREEVSIKSINVDVSMASVQDNNEYTEYEKPNMYISTFVTAYARLKLYEDELEALDRRVIYIDTGYMWSAGHHIIHPDTMVLLDFALQRLVLTGAHLTLGLGLGLDGGVSAEEAHMSQFGTAGQGKQTHI